MWDGAAKALSTQERRLFEWIEELPTSMMSGRAIPFSLRGLYPQLAMIRRLDFPSRTRVYYLRTDPTVDDACLAPTSIEGSPRDGHDRHSDSRGARA
jgi:hypothetical protein